ncbi:GTPBP3 [Branchiostoma lanceolatum]|uniref:5-taurinomethyluridine-[tRNA] synthase subunit GTPB3, mitochondrial n=2 Tax=Branchiostoma lanceolatum TaxID=7740 RepID=A0A8K0EGQ8_BRALA|nr:GTPBP3 [Branchiostoma lanceolatum]
MARTAHQACSSHNISLFTSDFAKRNRPRGVFARFSSSNYGCGFDSTIFALSSGHGKCGVAVVRVSGPHASSAVRRLTRRPVVPAGRRAALRRLYDPAGEPLDKGLVIWFPGPHSFTGEDSCEFHVHGGPSVVTSLLMVLGGMEGLRPAEAGEFTKRAFQNGKLDLTEVEGLADLIHAETEAQRKQALRQMEGDLSRLYSDWSRRLLKCVANVEAYIDFSEDENIEAGVLDEVEREVCQLTEELERHLSDGRRGERLRSGVQVAILGQPNVGKSSLLNAVCQRPAAIVTPIAGTTRDVVESAVNLGGYPVLLSDTAGLRETEDIVEREGVRRARQRAQQADISVLVLDAADVMAAVSRQPGHYLTLQQYVQDHIPDLGLQGTTFDTNDGAANPADSYLIVVNKSDLVEGGGSLRSLLASSELATEGDGAKSGDVCVMSCLTGEGMDAFLQLLQLKVKLMCGNPLAGNPSFTQARHRAHLTSCVQALRSYTDTSDRSYTDTSDRSNANTSDRDLVLAAEELRTGLRQLGKITGRMGAEEILDVIFRDFCIGK